MKIIKVVYDDESNFIVDTINKLKKNSIVDFYNIDDYKQKKKAIPIMTRYGTKKVPLVVFANENLDETTAIWSEQNPDWDVEINKILK